jgi:DNA modification methylase
MNILWESWLKAYTDAKDEAIVNRTQKKDASRYQELMTNSLAECYRVLRPGHWLVLVFMNSSEDIWDRIRSAVLDSGFRIERIDIFDKQHGTFKQFVSDNTAGADLMLHCRKPQGAMKTELRESAGAAASVMDFLHAREGTVPMLPYHRTRISITSGYKANPLPQTKSAFGLPPQQHMR